MPLNIRCRCDPTFIHKAFMLTELLVAFVVVIVLASLLFPVLTRIKEQTNLGVCVSNLRSIGSGYGLYFIDNEGQMPPYWNPEVMPSRLIAISPYMEISTEKPDQGVLECPSARLILIAAYSNVYNRNSYHQNRGWATFSNSATARKPISAFSNPSNAIIVYEQWGKADSAPPEINSHSAGRNILYADLHVETRADLINIDMLRKAQRFE